jgi:hypothetical protein
MNNILHVKKEIEDIINFLVSNSLSTFQQYPIIKDYPENIKKIEWDTVSNLSICLKNLEYNLIYSEISKNHDYTFKLIDGNIIQMLYTFKNNELYSHRLAMFPSPDLESFQNQPEIYENDELYADIIAKNLVSFPIRFDFCKDEVISTHEHPLSHVSLGQYKNCRIPAYGPISPQVFMKFILENFYNTFYEIYKSSCRSEKCSKIITIRELEKEKLHFNII